MEVLQYITKKHFKKGHFLLTLNSYKLAEADILSSFLLNIRIVFKQHRLRSWGWLLMT